MEDKTKSYKIIAIGTSAGGIKALKKLFMNINSYYVNIPIVVVLHLGNTSLSNLIQVFSSHVNITILEASDKMKLSPGKIYFAPADYHLLINEQYEITLSYDEKVNFSRPSIDVTFKSIALAFGKFAIGILLTGANNDGASGLKFISELGGYTIVQEPEEALIKTMPQSAIDIFEPDIILPLQKICKHLEKICNKKTKE